MNMKPGYYITTRPITLRKGSKRVGVPSDTWLVTDGNLIGVFDAESHMDWITWEWLRGDPVMVHEAEGQLAGKVTKVPASQIERKFQDLMYTEPGDPVPQMPMPPLSNIEPYLRARGRVASTMPHASYDFR